MTLRRDRIIALAGKYDACACICAASYLVIAFYMFDTRLNRRTVSYQSDSLALRMQGNILLAEPDRSKLQAIHNRPLHCTCYPLSYPFLQVLEEQGLLQGIQ